METPMHRRNLLKGTFTGAGALLAAAMSAVLAKAADPEKSKVVYHLTDLDKVGFVLGNIRNHFEGAGGPDKVTIALVVHGAALKAFHSVLENAEVTSRIGGLRKHLLTRYTRRDTMSS